LGTGSLKEFFHRARPSELHHSFSFPSGHSTSVYFILGFLFFIALPALYSSLSQQSGRTGPADAASRDGGASRSVNNNGTGGRMEGAAPALNGNGAGNGNGALNGNGAGNGNGALNGNGAGIPAPVRAAAESPRHVTYTATDLLELLVQPRTAAALTIAGGVVTQSGRLLADVHWTSDVLAGALWGSSGVAMAMMVQNVVYKFAEIRVQAAAEAQEAAAEAAMRRGTNGASTSREELN
jgi:hypothetical protein